MERQWPWPQARVPERATWPPTPSRSTSAHVVEVTSTWIGTCPNRTYLHGDVPTCHVISYCAMSLDCLLERVQSGRCSGASAMASRITV
jgi:hypothetical protein